MKSISLVIFVFAVFISAGASAQYDTAYPRSAAPVEKTRYSSEMDRPNAISLEGLGRGGVYSINYDHMLNDSLALGAGLAYYSLSIRDSYGDSGSGQIFILPAYLNYYLGSTPSHFYLTGGLDFAFATATYSDDSMFRDTEIAPVLGLGYEYRADGGFLFRIAPYLLVSSSRIFLWGGVSVGAAF